MKIVRIDNTQLSKIQPLWEELNIFHTEISTHFKYHFESLTFRSRLEEIEKSDAFALFAATENTAFAGYCIVSITNRIGEIDSIYIRPEYRNKKAGRKLMEEAEAWLNSHNITRIQISVVEGNHAAIKFYQGNGYCKKTTVLEKHLSNNLLPE